MNSARLKIERADQHIADIEARLDRLKESHRSCIQLNPHFGNEVIEHHLGDGKAEIDLALLIGDAVHNLKCALDYTWIGCLEQLGLGIGKSEKFPIYPTLHDLKHALKRRKIHVTHPDLYSFMLSEIEAHKGRNYDLWAIHDLDRSDKHRLLTPLVTVGGVSGIQMEDEAGVPQDFQNGWAVGDSFPLRIAAPLGWHVKNEGQLTIEVTFYEGTAAYGLEVADALLSYSRLVHQLLERFELWLAAHCPILPSEPRSNGTPEDVKE